MSHGSQGWAFLLVITLLAANTQNSQSRILSETNGVKTSVYLSPKFMLQPGSVVDKFYYDIDFPRGHIAIKSFNAEVVDDAGNPIPLHETYLHHWVALRYYQRKGVEVPKYTNNVGFQQSDFIVAGNSGICSNTLTQDFGLGSETRRTATLVPDPYGIQAGNPSEVPSGYEERWMLNVHAIDTRGTVDSLGCTECRCDLYNITEDKHGRPLKPNYLGGLFCCFDDTRCRLRNGVESVKRGLYMKYTVKWVDWDESIVPVKVYIFDVTDTWKKASETTGLSTRHECHIEYDIEPCTNGAEINGCSVTKRIIMDFPNGGDVIYGVAHQHIGGLGSALYGEDGRLICSSFPIYGEGNDVGDEKGYVVGMTTCYPQPGSVKIADGEILTLESNYSNFQGHTGVMGIFYILVAKASSNTNSSLHAPAEVHKKATLPSFVWGEVISGAAIVVAAVVVAYRRRSLRENNGYQSILT